MDIRHAATDTHRVISSERYLLGRDAPNTPDNDRAVAGGNGLGAVVFLFLLLVVGVITTVQLQRTAFLAWGLFLFVGLISLAGGREQTSQDAWLEGTVLTVRRKGAERSCDLADVRTASLGFTSAGRGEPPFMVVRAVDDRTDVRVRYVMRTGKGHALNVEEMRMLADAFDAAPDDARQAHSIADQLRVEATTKERTEAEQARRAAR